MMSMTMPSAAALTGWKSRCHELRCPRCAGDLAPSASGTGLVCHGCGTEYPIRDEVLVIKDEPAEDNRITRDFYNSALWPKFRFWERFFFVCNGGEKRSRNVILKHLPQQPGLKLLDIAIGDGAYHRWLPRDWDITGVDVSTAQLAACRRRNPDRDLRLTLVEAEALPFRDQSFDAVLSIGGFNHFSDPETALREMVRVVPSGATIVVSDELPNLTERMVGRKIGLPGLDRWVVARMMNLGYDFADLVERHRAIDIAGIGQRVLKNSQYQTIWFNGGYVMVGQAP